MRHALPTTVALATLLAALLAAPVAAQRPADPDMPGPLREVGFRQELGEPLPLDLPFVDERGRAVELGDYFGELPVVLALVYFECPQLCNMVLNGVVSSLKVLEMDPGEDFEVVVVSFDPEEGHELAAAKMGNYLRSYDRPGTEGGWHFLTGDAPAIDALTSAAGFDYVYDEDTDEFAHASGIVVATPSGKVSRYLFGIDYPPKDLRFALVESSEGSVGGAVEQLLLYCYRYDPAVGKYSLAIMNLVRAGAVLTVVGMLVFMIVMRRRENRGGDLEPKGTA